MQLEIEKQALKKEEKNESGKAKLAAVDAELDDLRKQLVEMKKHWEKEKEVIKRIRDIKEKMDKTRLDEASAEKEGNLARVSEIRYSVLVNLEKELGDEAKKLAAVQKDKKMLKEEVDEEDIAKVVAQWTGIPLTKLMESEMQKLVHMEGVMETRIVGQDDAVGTIANAVRRSRSGLGDPKKPLGSFLFLGPTGVGKTHMAKTLAWFLFNDPDAMIRIDMSEYMEKHSVSRLIGAPPGYVGYEEGGQLTEKVRRRPYSVVLLDEIEKAHPDVFNILLQIMDEGRLTDNQGHVVDFKNTIIIMTSNIGSQYYADKTSSKEDLKREVAGEIKKHFRPEFLNRIDEIVVFNQLTEGDILKIVDLELSGIKERLRGRRITLDVTDKARKELAKLGFDPDYGARPLKRLIQREVQDKLALEILKGNIADGDGVRVDIDGKKGFVCTEE
jgi:ATP-dependent Clp protease ATP-binding subunit ClpB